MSSKPRYIKMMNKLYGEKWAGVHDFSFEAEEIIRS